MKFKVYLIMACGLVTTSLLLMLCSCNQKRPFSQWEVYNGSKSNLHYSSLKQIDTSNVNQLTVAWTYHSGDSDTVNHSQIQCNPIIVDGLLYGTGPTLQLFAVDAATGQEKWIFNPFETFKGSHSFFANNNCRGLALWRGDDDEKYLFYTAGISLFCLNATDGTRVRTFGDEGKIDLSKDLGREVSNLFVTATSPGIIYKDLLIVGTRVDESAASAPGHIRAYNVRTGKLVWIFHTIPYPGEHGYDTWNDPEAYKHIGGANAWSGLSLDEERGIVFASTGSASFDYYGGKRVGNNLFANCILALNATTGKRIWHFQTIHHDVWDRDLSSAPVLITLHIKGKSIDAIAQTTKTGFVFILDRETGKPVYPVEELPVTTESEADGEILSPTQPVPTKPEPFMRQSISVEDLNELISDSSYRELEERFATMKNSEMFTPLWLHNTIVFPGLDGGGEWGGPSVDPETGILYVNANEMPWVLSLFQTDPANTSNEKNLQAGMRLFKANCATCHGFDRNGAGNAPSLVDVNRKYNIKSFLDLVSIGRRMMPGFGHLSKDELRAIASFILDIDSIKDQPFIAAPDPEEPYRHLAYNVRVDKFLTKEGYPGISPPWGTLNAINLNTGEYVWRDTLGDYPEFLARGLHTGTENYGGPVTTAGGLVFIGATRDGKFRAYNKVTGSLLWETSLPAPAFATPAIYEVAGREYIVIACGGGKLGTSSSDAYVAYAIPDPKQH